MTLKVYNVLGAEVITLVEADQRAGQHVVVWDGRDHMGQDVASGLYFCRLGASKFAQTVKMMLLK